MNAQDPLTFEERDSLTIHGETISAQIRHYDSSESMALHIMEDAPRSSENGSPVLVSRADVDKLRELLLEADRRAND